MQSRLAANFDEWREQARALLASKVPPAEVQWHDKHLDTLSLFDAQALPRAQSSARVSADFVALAKYVAAHADPVKWALLYECLWRLTHGEKHLLRLVTDPLVRRLNLMVKAVRRDAHKTKAFVRFREYQDESGVSHYVAWHNPDHDVLPLVAGFFQRRFNVMRWTILTPYRGLHWDGEALHDLPGVPAYEHPQEDMIEDVWRAYYRATFNPARIKLKMMRREMPVRHWKTLPETAQITSMLQNAEQRVADMLAQMEKFHISS
jgi:probable DNA metabolism protein